MFSSLTVLSMLFGSLHGTGLLLDVVMPHIHMTDSPTVPTAGYQKPAFCHDLECPKFTILEKNDKFELRKYEPSVWVTTEIITKNYTRQQGSDMFYKLFHYISGNNSMGMKIAMTAPVVDEFLKSGDLVNEMRIRKHFMVPFALQGNPPRPTDADVFIRRLPEMNVYVRSYGGFSNDARKSEQLKILSADLLAANKQYRDIVYYTAGYDGPYAFVRHNEVWLNAM